MGKDNQRQPVIFSRPRSRSLEDYKAWINELYESLMGGNSTDDDMTKAEWESDWLEFWQEIDGVESNNPQE